MNFGTNFDEGYNGISISRYANPKIGWEISHKMNVGFELKLFNDLEIQAEYFKERRTNILQERADIPSLMGFQAPIRANIGEAKGQGVDISLDYSHIFNKNLWTTIRGNFTYASSEFSEYEEPDYSATPWRSKIGSKLSQTYGYIAERLFVDDEDVANSPKQQFGEYTAGDIKYKDINRDGIIDEQDIVPIGYPTTPEIIYGFGFSVGYKAFDFNCFFQGSARSSFFISPLRITPFAQPYDPDNELGGKQANNALLQVIADSAHVVHIVYIELYLSFEDAIVGFDGQFTDIHVELAGDDLGHFVQQSHAVYTFYIYGDEERQILVSVPFGGDDTVSVATFKAGGNGALALVDDNTVLFVDVSQYVVTRNGVATVSHDIVL